MTKKITRQPIVVRDDFSYDEKQRIAAKSNNKCCHCGKECYTGYGATIDHFVPLNKGGTNQMINLIMLCEDCNHAKSDLIYDPKGYLKHLNEDEYEKLEGYFNSYITSFEFVERRNLLACDRYDLKVVLPSRRPQMMGYKKSKKQNPHIAINTVMLKRATEADIPRLTEYFVKYLKKYNILDSQEAAS